jgi:hypothetical protein
VSHRGLQRFVKFVTTDPARSDTSSGCMSCNNHKFCNFFARISYDMIDANEHNFMDAKIAETLQHKAIA